MIGRRGALTVAVLVAACAPGSQAGPGAAPTDATGVTPSAAVSPEVQPADGVSVTVLDIEKQTDSLGSGVTYRVEVRNDRAESVAVVTPVGGSAVASPTEEGVVEVGAPASREQRGDEAPPAVDTLILGAGETLPFESSGASQVPEGARLLRVCVEILERGRGFPHAQEQRLSLDLNAPALLACSEPTPIEG